MILNSYTKFWGLVLLGAILLVSVGMAVYPRNDIKHIGFYFICITLSLTGLFIIVFGVYECLLKTKLVRNVGLNHIVCNHTIPETEEIYTQSIEEDTYYSIV